METIGIIAPMPQECRALIRLAGKTERVMLDKFRCYRFQLSGRNCLLVESGIGFKRAREAVRILIAAADPELIVSFGVAGAARDDLKVGDVIAASQTFLLEKDRKSLFNNLYPLSVAATLAAAHVLERRGARMVSGTVVTTRMSDADGLLPEEMPNPVLDMETAGIAQVASEHGTAVLALRAVSDGPSEPLSFNLEAMTDEDFNLSILKAAGMVILRPWLALASLRIVRNVRKASDNAAAALAAVMAQADILERLRDKDRIPVEFLPLVAGSVDAGLDNTGEYL
jgi:adenosylhomocysteine nucleosidase